MYMCVFFVSCVHLVHLVFSLLLSIVNLNCKIATRTKFKATPWKVMYDLYNLMLHGDSILPYCIPTILSHTRMVKSPAG